MSEAQHFNDEEAGRILGYVTALAEGFGLRDWRIELVNEPCAAAYSAEVETWPQKRRADIRCQRTILTDDGKDVRRRIVHELVHCHQALMIQSLGTLEKHLTVGELHIMQAMFREIEERCVDDLACAIAPYLPLPTWGGPEVTVTKDGLEHVAAIPTEPAVVSTHRRMIAQSVSDDGDPY